MKQIIILIIILLVIPTVSIATCRYGIIVPMGDGPGTYGYANWQADLQAGTYNFSDWTYKKYNKKKVIGYMYERDNNGNVSTIYTSSYTVVLELNRQVRTGECYSKNCEIEADEANADCEAGWEWTDEANCEYECTAPPCESEEAQADSECGTDNWTWTDEANCEWACNTCTEEKSALESECGDLGYVIDDETCVGHCNPEPDCSDEYMEKLAQCGDAGIKEWNNEQCVGSCNDNDCEETDPCIEYSDNCYNQTCDLYGVESMDCQSSEDADGCWTITSQECNCKDDSQDCSQYRNVAENSCGGSNNIESYYCNEEDFDNRFFYCIQPETDPNNPPPDDTAPGETPDEESGESGGDPDDPENQPEPDPVDDPEATEDEKQNTRLDAIKQSLDTQIDQNNVQIGELGKIVSNTHTTAKNTATIANNQREIQKGLSTGFKAVTDTLNKTNEDLGKRISDRIEEVKSSNESGFDGIVDAINGKELSLDFGELKANGTVPTLNGDEYDSSLPTDNDYTEHDDYQTLATDQAGNYITEMELIEEQELFEASITAIGQPCITGNITFHGNNIPVSICFNKNWMLTGYAIMKVIFIGIAYIQSGIMLTKSII